MLKLEFPNESHKIMYEKLIEEWWEAEDIPTSPKALFIWKNFNEFLSLNIKNITNSDIWVNSHLFLLLDGVEILWGIHIRHHIHHPKYNENIWHIWYWILPKHRRKWYATKMLELWLFEAKNLWLEKVLITCSLDNIGSKKVIIKNWWVFERTSKDWNDNRYWINLIKKELKV